MNSAIYLDDNKENNQIKISDVDSYEFEASPNDDPNRFILHFVPTGINDTDLSNNQIQIWSSKNVVHIINNKNIVGDISIVNLFGQVIGNYELTGETNQQIDFNAALGLYIVNVKANCLY